MVDRPKDEDGDKIVVPAVLTSDQDLKKTLDNFESSLAYVENQLQHKIDLENKKYSV